MNDTTTLRKTTKIYLAGINNSEPNHWQSLWFKGDQNAYWIDHAQWDQPDRIRWVEELQKALENVSGPKIIIAHSLGCLLCAHWITEHKPSGLLGAFLVAPPAPASPRFPASATGFQNPFLTRISCPNVVIASQNDPYSSFNYSQALALHWGSRFVDAGVLGHINLRSGLDDWSQGRAWLSEFEAGLR
jgi:uncharacterized protein